WLALVAETRVARGQYRSAFFFYRQALEKQPNLRGVHAALAVVYRATGHPDWADVEEKKEGRPDCADEKAACDFRAGRFAEVLSSPSLYWRSRAANRLAMQAFSELGKLPESTDLHAIKAEILASHGQHLESAAEWRAALKLAPGDAGIERQLANALYSGRDFAAVLPMLGEMLKREPGSAE